MTFSSLRRASTAVAAMLVFNSFSTEASTLDGKVVVRMGQDLPAIKISFTKDESDVNFITVGSFDVDTEDDGYFQVGGALDCVNYVSSNQIIISSEVISTAMHQSLSFFKVGERLLLAIEVNEDKDKPDQVSIINRIDTSSDCQFLQMKDFTFLTAMAGKVNVVN
jgi:hypothetical protein